MSAPHSLLTYLSLQVSLIRAVTNKWTMGTPGVNAPLSGGRELSSRSEALPIIPVHFALQNNKVIYIAREGPSSLSSIRLLYIQGLESSWVYLLLVKLGD